MKQRTKEFATEWLKTAKSKDKFTIEGTPHSKKEIEELLGFKYREVKQEDIKEESYADMGQTPDDGLSQES
tara:strand:+ start:1476 stop:1688 length:213 start_codon:yes stop_codon:yes gene_type:complete